MVWSTERLLDGMVGLATLLRAAPFVVAGIFSGLEAENVAPGRPGERAHPDHRAGLAVPHRRHLAGHRLPVPRTRHPLARRGTEARGPIG